jgi:hypothetical protein
MIQKYKRQIPALLLAIAGKQNEELNNPSRVKHVMMRFWEMLDSETVRLFVWPFYSFLLLMGVYGLLFAERNVLIAATMSSPVYNTWNGIIVCASLAVMVGLILRHGGAPIGQLTNPQADRDYLGLILQTGGHTTMCLNLLGYEIAGIQGTYWGQGANSLFLVPPVIIGCLFLAVQTLRKLNRIERKHRELKREQ